MRRLIIITLVVLMWLPVVCAPRSAATPPSEVVDMSSAGAPMIFGSLGGSVAGSSDLTSDLSVTINFGELSPINTNSIVKVIVPIALRSSGSYQVSVTVVGSPTGDANSVKLSDVGFGLQNLRPLGPKASTCGINSVISPPFNNDPSTSVAVGPVGRAIYPSTLASIVSSTVVLGGPQLSKAGKIKPRENNGYAIDAVFAVAPQYFTPGNFVVTVNFTITTVCDACGC